MLAAFLNLEGDLYYELLSAWMGKGDKETFAHALTATDTPYHLVATPAASAGLSLKVCHSSVMHVQAVPPSAGLPLQYAAADSLHRPPSC